MESIISIDLIFLLVSFLIFYKLKFEKKFIRFIFKEIIIYLPLTEDDYKKLLSIKKEKKNSNVKGIIRSCDMNEYVYKSDEKNFLEFDVIILFYLCNLTCIILNTCKNFIVNKIYFQKNNNENNNFLNNNNNFNIISSFILVNFSYILYNNIKKLFQSKSNKKTFIINFIFSFLIFFLIQYFNEKFFSLNYSNTIEILNDRINSILSHSNISFVTYDEFKYINKLNLKIFYSLIFSLYFSIFFKSNSRMSYFDHFLLLACEKAELPDNIVRFKLEYVIKLRSIINIFLIFCLIDPLLKNPLNLSNKILISIIFILMFIEMLCGKYILWYSAFMFNVNNYSNCVNFAKNPSKEKYVENKIIVNYRNSQFWEIMLSLFENCFYGFLIYLNFICKFQGKKYFFENILYIILIAYVLCRALWENVVFFYSIFTKKVHMALS